MYLMYLITGAMDEVFHREKEPATFYRYITVAILKKLVFAAKYNKKLTFTSNANNRYL